MQPPLVILVNVLVVAAAAGAEQIGFREDFSAADGWEVSKWPGITGMESITSDGRQATFTTMAGTFMTGASAALAPSWPDWDQHAPAGLAIIVKKYTAVVDLDRLAPQLRDPAHRAPLIAQLDMTVEGALAATPVAADREQLLDAYRTGCEALNHTPQHR